MKSGQPPDKDAPTALTQGYLGRSYEGPLRVVVTAGPDQGSSVALALGKYVVGKAEGSHLVLSDTLISRRHLEIEVDAARVRVRDLGSSNGSFVFGTPFESITWGVGTSLQLGATELRLVDDGSAASVSVSASESFGALYGRSRSMREAFAVLERVAATDTAVLIEGETGVGKELAAEALHRASPRADGPFIVCDLAGVSAELVDRELFGFVKDGFPGAYADRPGAFVQADGGTLFLDGVADLDPDVQPRILRAIERRQIQPVGGTAYVSTNVRVLAATNQDLETEVREGRFRRDLFHRLAVVRIELPPLRHRPDDIPLLAQHFLAEVARPTGRPPLQLTPDTLAALGRHDWPGNVRELKNVLEQAASLSDGSSVDTRLLSIPDSGPVILPEAISATGLALPFKEAREQLIEVWEREYLNALLAKAGGNVSLAARRAGLSRVYMHELIKKRGITR